MPNLVDKFDTSKTKVPSIAKSEAIIAEKASAAIQTLRAWDALDLAEALGLSNYITKEK